MPAPGPLVGASIRVYTIPPLPGIQGWSIPVGVHSIALRRSLIMNSHPEELALARAYSRSHPFEALSQPQMNQIMDRGRVLHKWFKAHQTVHCAIGLLVILFMLGADYLVLTRMPRLFLPAVGSYSWGLVLLGSCVVGSVHSYLMY